ncbi:MAG TPA: DUF1844 domain-containing protein [Desulfobacteraceae bacterium]|nr:DUF1844 domain-containing protein [Desulfobacteraceae bacterium]
MDVEGKGFVIKDRRAFDEEGRLKKEVKEEEKKREREDRAKSSKEERQRAPLPEVNFSSFIISLSSSALLHMGEIPDPQTGQKKKDMELARHTIDTIALLKEKTKGNLNSEEERLLNSILTDLRLRFVKLTK